MRLLFFVLLIVFEIFIFIKVSHVLGFLVTLLLIILTSFLGAFLVRAQGVLSLMRFRQKLASGENPIHEIGKSFFILFAGFLLFLPGFFTDFLGLLLLIPRVQGYLTAKFMPKFSFFKRKRGTGYTVEGEYERKKESNKEIEIKKEDDHSLDK